MSVQPAIDPRVRASAVDRVLKQGEAIDTVALDVEVPVETLERWVQEEVDVLEANLRKVREALSHGAKAEARGDTKAERPLRGNERPWSVDASDASDDTHAAAPGDEPSVDVEPIDAADDATPAQPAATTAATTDPLEAMRRQVVEAINCPNAVLCVTTPDQIHATFAAVRSEAHVAGVIFVVDPTLPADADADHMGPNDSAQEVDAVGSVDAVDPKAPAAAPFSASLHRGAMPVMPGQSHVNGSARRAHPYPQPKPVTEPSNGKSKSKKSNGNARPEDPTHLDLYMPDEDEQPIDERVDSGVYPMEEGVDENDRVVINEKVVLIDFGDEPDDTAARHADNDDDAELPGVVVDESLTLKFKCEYCGRKLKAKGETLGQHVRCKGCDEKIRAPKHWSDPRVYYSSRAGDPNADSSGGSTL
ncbi:MAG: hypothetical protein GC159_02275 [Phycisphaera sp.]|nr:hypothetical protein [Phycisphaera sp.]